MRRRGLGAAFGKTGMASGSVRRAGGSQVRWWWDGDVGITTVADLVVATVAALNSAGGAGGFRSPLAVPVLGNEA